MNLYDVPDRRDAVVLIFESAAAARRRVAGVSAVARLVREFGQAGVDRLYLALADDGALGEECRADLRRVAGSVTVEQLRAAEILGSGERGGPEWRLFSGGHLIPAELIRGFIDGDDLCLAWNGRSLARRTRRCDLSPDPHNWLGPAPDQCKMPGESQIIALADARAATRQMLLRTGKSGDGFVSRWFNRPVSRRISAVAINLPWLRPDHVTLVTAAIALAMFGCFLFGGSTALVVGGVLFHLASVIDGVDGEIARVSFRSSVRGAVFDMVVDRLTILLFFLGTTIALARLEGIHHAFVGGWGFAAAAIGVLLLGWGLRRTPPPRSYSVIVTLMRAKFQGGIARWITETLITLIGRDVFSLVLPLFIVIGVPWLVTWAFTGFTTIWLIVVLCTLPTIVRNSRRSTAGPDFLPASRSAAEPEAAGLGR